MIPSSRYRIGRSRAEQAFKQSFCAALRPPPKLTVSEWAELHAYLSPETSGINAGKFHAFPYQKGVMDAASDPAVRMITVMKSARLGYTKALDNIIGYFIHQDPSPILVVQPRNDDAEDYSRTEILPMLRDTPVLANIVGEFKRDSEQRISKRMFSNGASVSFVGANSPSGFRRISARVICFDEVDGYREEGAGREGDQIKLGAKRAETFWNSKIIIGSTPTFKETSLIERSYLESDQRRFYVPCPHCGAMQTLQWKNLFWDKSERRVAGAIEGHGHWHLPHTAYFSCSVNGCLIYEHDKVAMVQAGEWRAELPFTGHAGFHIWSAYSLWPNASWANMVTEFLLSQGDPLQLRTFTNGWLGETWETDAEMIDPSGLLGRGENYGPMTIPAGVRFLTAGVDVQGDRLELQVLGFGRRGEIWVVDYAILYGDPSQQPVWTELDTLLLRRYVNEQGLELRLRAACIDIGGHQMQQVIGFCLARRGRRIHPIMGQAGPNRPIWPERTGRTKAGHVLFRIGVDAAKDMIYGRLRISKPGAGYIHFPAGDLYGEDYFEQLTAERVIVEKRMGVVTRKWELPSGRRNEVLDTFVYALAARMSLPIEREDEFVVATPEEVVEAMGDIPRATRPRLDIRAMARRMNPRG